MPYLKEIKTVIFYNKCEVFIFLLFAKKYMHTLLLKLIKKYNLSPH